MGHGGSGPPACRLTSAVHPGRCGLAASKDGLSPTGLFQRKVTLAEKGQKLAGGHPTVTLSFPSTARQGLLSYEQVPQRAPRCQSLLSSHRMQAVVQPTAREPKAAGHSPHNTGIARACAFGFLRVPDLPNLLTQRNLLFQLPLGPTRTRRKGCQNHFWRVHGP